MKKNATYLDDSLIDYHRIISVLVIIVVVAFGAPILRNVGENLFGGWEYMESVDLTAEIKDAKRLKIINNSHSLISVEYSQFNDDNEYRSDNRLITVETTKSDDGREATMNLTIKQARSYKDYGSALLIHGPSLEKIEIDGPVRLQYSGSHSINIVNKGAEVSLRAGGRYDNVTVTSEKSSTSRLDYANIKNLKVSLNGGVVTAGEVDSIDVDFLTGCEKRPVSTARNVLTAEAVLDNTMIYNGTEQPLQSITNDCGRVVIGRQ